MSISVDARNLQTPPRHDLFGYPVDGFVKEGLLAFVADRVAQSHKTVVANLNLHGLHCLTRSSEMRDLFAHRDTYVHIDGMPIVWLSKLKGVQVGRDNRLTYLDWAVDMLADAHRNGWKVAYLGSNETVCAQGVTFFKAKFDGLDLRGWDGFFDMSDTTPESKLSRTLSEIDAYAPDLLIVGMGNLRQETFLQRHKGAVNFKVAFCSGAFFEYFVGGQDLPPRWTGRLGVEWLYRLLKNPSRYGHRYLVEPLSLAIGLTGLMIRRRKFL